MHNIPENELAHLRDRRRQIDGPVLIDLAINGIDLAINGIDLRIDLGELREQGGRVADFRDSIRHAFRFRL